MQCNLLFYNLPESEQEDPFTIIREVLNEKMGIDENGDIEIEWAHRLGRKREDGKPRAIVAKFLRYQDKEHIRKISPPTQRHKYWYHRAISQGNC